jgi:sugar lactone lactonase YvrE
MATSGSGTFYFADVFHNRIRKVDARGTITTVVGNGTADYSGEGGPATAAAIHMFPATEASIATDALGNLYFADGFNHRIRRVDAAGIVTTVVGHGEDGNLAEGATGIGFPAFAALVGSPSGLTVDGAGSLYYRDKGIIRKVRTPTAVPDFGRFFLLGSTQQPVWVAINSATTLANALADGDFAVVSNDCALATPLPAGTICKLILQFTPTRPGVRVGKLRFVDDQGHRFAFPLSGTGVGPNVSFIPGVLSTVAGNPFAAKNAIGDGGPATSAFLNGPSGIKFDADGNLYIAESAYASSRIRKVDTGGTISTVAGNGISGHSGDGGPAINASLYSPVGISLDNFGDLIIADQGNSRIRRVDDDGVVRTIVGTGEYGFSGDGGPAIQARIAGPFDSAVDPAGNLYIADYGNGRVRKVDSHGVISTVAGGGDLMGRSADGLPATRAGFVQVDAIDVDFNGNLYIADYSPGLVSKVDPQGTITTLAGTRPWDGNPTFDNNVPALEAVLDLPTGVASDAQGNVYIANMGGPRISKVEKASGLLLNIAGNGAMLYPGADTLDGGPATAGSLDRPGGVTTDNAGNLYFSTVSLLQPGLNFAGRVRKLDTTVGALTFATTPPPYIGSTSDPQSVRLTNEGNSPLDLLEFAWPQHFNPAPVGNDCVVGVSIAPGGSCNIGVAFTPQVTGDKITGTLLVFDNTFNRSHAVTLSGNAQALPPPATVVQVWVETGNGYYPLLGSTRNRLPWKIERIRVLFSQAITSGAPASLAGLPVIGLDGLGTESLTWTLSPLTIGSFSAALATSGAAALRDEFGTAVAPMSFAFRVLWGDVNDDGVVSAADMVAVSQARAHWDNPFANLNGDEVIDLQDVQVVRDHIGTHLP